MCIRDSSIAGVDGEPLRGPMTSASLIGDNLDLHLDKVLTGIIQN